MYLSTHEGLYKIPDKTKTGSNILDLSKIDSTNITDYMFYEINNINTYFSSDWFYICILHHDSMIKRGRIYNYNILLSNKIIISEKYNAFSLKTIKKFSKSFIFNEQYINKCLVKGCVDIIEYLLITNYNQYIQYMDLDIPSSYGYVNLLKLLRAYGVVKYCYNAFDNAIRNGHIDVLEWWFQSGLELKYYDKTISFCQNSNVLTWCKNNGFNILCNTDVMKWLSYDNNINVLDWWYKNNLLSEYNELAMDEASGEGHVRVLEWWVNSGLPLKYSENAIYKASVNGHTHVLEWWKNSGLPLKYNELAFTHTCFKDLIRVLEWWKNSGLPIKYDLTLLKSFSKSSPSIKKIPDVVRKWLLNEDILNEDENILKEN